MLRLFVSSYISSNRRSDTVITPSGAAEGGGCRENQTSKADLIAALNAGFAHCGAVHDSFTDAGVAETIKRGEAPRTKLSVLWGNVIHDGEHYGNLVTYMRIKGLVPPSTEGQ